MTVSVWLFSGVCAGSTKVDFGLGFAVNMDIDGCCGRTDCSEFYCNCYYMTELCSMRAVACPEFIDRGCVACISIASDFYWGRVGT